MACAPASRCSGRCARAPSHRFLPCLPAVRQGLVPHLAPQGMVGQEFDRLGHPLSGEHLESLDDPGVQCPPSLLEQRLVGHLLGEGVLEGVLDLGEQARLVEELGGLQMGEAPAERRLGHLGHGLEERQRHLVADDGSSVQKRFLLRREPVDTRRQHRLHRGRHLNARERPGQAIGPALPEQYPSLR
jgi:hypothetical protein